MRALRARTFVLALNMVDVVAVTKILVLHVIVIGHHSACHYDFAVPPLRTMRGCTGEVLGGLRLPPTQENFRVDFGLISRFSYHSEATIESGVVFSCGLV